MKKGAKILSIILIVSFLISYFPSTTFASEIKISTIKDLTVSVYVDQSYILPKTINATMSNKTTKKVSVTWSPQIAVTSTSGTFVYQGKVKGYAKQIRLTLKVLPLDEEVQSAISYGLVPKEIQGDYNKTITFAQYAQMLTNLITVWDSSRLPEWKSIIAKAAKSEEIMHREDGILAASYAVVLMGANTRSNFYDDILQISQDEIDKQTKDLSWNYPNFSDWDKLVYPDTKCNYMWGGVTFFMHRVSKVSLKAVYPYDITNHSMHLQDQLTRKEAIQSVLRLAQTDAAILEPDGNYVSVEKVGTYDKNIITDALLNKSSKLPEVTQSKLPSEWKGTGYSAHKDGRHAYKDFSETDVRFLADNGFNMMRLFLGFSTLRYPDYTKDPELVNTRELEDLDQLVAWCMKYDIHLQISMINLPTRIIDTDWKGENFPTQKEWDLMDQYWTMLANRYSNIPSKYLSFDLCNEIEPDINQADIAKDAFRKTVEAIRQVDDKRVLLYSFQGNPNLQWADDMASLGLAIGCHPYYPQFIATADNHYTQKNPYAKAVWPVVWFPMGQISCGQAPLTISGAVSASKLSLHILDSSVNAKADVFADDQLIKTIELTSDHFENNEYFYYDKIFSLDIPQGTQQISIKIRDGYAFIDTVIIDGSLGETRIMPHDVCDYPDNATPLPLIVNADGSYTNSENRIIDGEEIFKVDVMPLMDIAEQYKVGFMVNEFGMFGSCVNWDINVVAAYHDTVLKMLEQKGIGWCYCELSNVIGKHIVLMFGESQWAGTTIDQVTYTNEKGHKDTLYVNKQLLDVFRKYTLNKSK